MSLNDYQTVQIDGNTVDTETGEIIEENKKETVVDFRNAKQA